MAAAILLPMLTGCGASPEASPAEESADDIGAEQAALTATLHRVGALPELPDTMVSKLSNPGLKAQALPAALPVSVDLSSKLPPVGDQANEGSCVGWAVGYATKTLQEVTEVKWPAHADDHTFSASWIYNQINGGKDAGSLISDAMALVVKSGADTISSFPYIAGDFTTKPGATSMSRAAHYQGQSWSTLGVTAANFKNALAGGNAVVVGFDVLPDMDKLDGTTNTVYDTDAGTRAQFQTACSNTAASIATCNATCNGVGKCGSCNISTGICTVPACTTKPCSRGGHAVAIVGYDDNAQTFRFINSWGSAFNGNGYGSFAYSFITNANLKMGAFVLVDKANTPGLQDSTMTWQETSGIILL